MIGGPSTLNPWYVVQEFRSLAMLGEMYYYQSDYSPHVEHPLDGGDQKKPEMFDEDSKYAQIFMNLNTAARIAKEYGAHIRVLVGPEDAKEFGRESK